MAEEPFPSGVSTPEPARRQRLDSTPTRSSSTSAANRHDHPYLIRTTSSSLLTRSNSIGSVHKPPLHVSVAPNSPALGRSQGRGHKHTKSQSSAPVPLPLPPQSPHEPEKTPLSAGSPSPDVKQAFGTGEGVGRLRRSDTLPSVHSSSPARSIKVEDLPTNPKAWTSTHLARYLSSALRVKGGGTLPAPVVRDIATFVVDQKLSGRAFLRLTQHDLEVMGMNQLWRPALLDASRVLRQNVVQGRIWGFGNMAEDIPASPSSIRTSSTNGTTATVTKATHMPSVPSTVFEDNSDDGGEAVSGPEDRYEGRNGWIARGMLTRSVSSLPGRTSAIGRVRDMVANFERSASGSSASENDSANEMSPFDFGSSNEAEQEVILSPLQEEAIGFSMQDRRPLQDDMEAGGDEAGFASGELTSGSEAGDEDEDDEDGFGGEKVKTVSDKIDDLQAGHSELEGEEIDSPGKDEDSSKDSDSSPTSSSSPLTPPPVYETDPVGLVTPSETEMTLHEDETSDDPDISSPKRHSRSPSSTLMLTSSQRRNPSFVAQISHDSGSDDTIENLIADFTASELEQHPMVTSWGANAWLDGSVKEGATAKKIQEPVFHSLSRRSGKAFRSQESSAGSGSAKLMSLFDDPALDKKTTVDVSVDASQPEETDDSRKIKELQEHQIRQQVLLDEFRERLEEVERRLEEMEAKEAEREERERTIEATATAKPEQVVASDPAGQLADQEGHVQERPSEDKGKEIVGREWRDPALGGLPSYVFLVGLGVAAICMRVVVKRVVGKKAPGMLGFL
ncbi:hypothetical protein M407DRAFT_94658 [Tulasnella calospora MUT 4182]|uniref:SAM domain-containing protein n=1 Tax=Tulasnella calospora MUT 4182 TaxID=1051891 RepID=A0A0C3LUI6_9AGAM|nr:hypothetical protein M407DRAFT_94658 [Tulasnella calospora MUT 4182]